MLRQLARRVGDGEIGEVHAEHAAHALHQRRMTVPPRALADALHERGLHRIDAAERRTVVALEHGQRGDAGGHAHRRGVEGAGVDHAVDAQQIEDVAPPRHRRERHAARQRLAEGRQVGRDAVVLLRAAEPHAEPGDHLVDAQQHAVPRAQFAHALEVPRPRQATTAVGHRRFHDDERDLIAALGEQRFEALDVVPGDLEGFLERHRRAALGVHRIIDALDGVRRRVRIRVAAPAEHVVDPTVVVAVEAHEARPTGEGARKTDDELHGLRAAGDETHLLGAGHMLDDLLGEHDLVRGLQHAGGDIEDLVELRMHGREVLAVAVTPDVRAHAEREVDQFSTIDIPHPLAFAADHEHGRFIGRAQVALPAGHHPPSALGEGLGGRAQFPSAGLIGSHQPLSMNRSTGSLWPGRDRLRTQAGDRFQFSDGATAPASRPQDSARDRAAILSRCHALASNMSV